jgi:glyoxylase-like metal-dependent hydrolase (beta-lactamase superfamily II)
MLRTGNGRAAAAWNVAEGTSVEEGRDWRQPGVFDVAPGVHRIPLPLPYGALRAVNVYAIEDGQELVLVDAGWAAAESQQRLEEALGDLGCSISDIGRFLVTHIHPDHYTQAVAIRRTVGSRVSLGAGERPSLEALHRPDTKALSAQVAQLRACGAEPVLQRLMAAGYGSRINTAEWEFPDDWLEGTSVLRVAGRELLVVATPGHTEGHVVFADVDNGMLFAGDHVLPHITPSIGFEVVPGEAPLRNYLQSLKVMRQMPDMRLLPAHGPVGPSVHARVDVLLSHHESRLDACANTVTQGASTAYESARALLWTRRERRFDDLDWFNQMLATIETAAHLDVLAARGRLVPSVADGVVEFTEP